MNRKIYYNLTKIKNGWLLNDPMYYDGMDIQSGTEESFYSSLWEALNFIGTDCIEDDKMRKIRLEYLVELRENKLI